MIGDLRLRGFRKARPYFSMANQRSQIVRNPFVLYGIEVDVGYHWELAVGDFPDGQQRGQSQITNHKSQMKEQ